MGTTDISLVADYNEQLHSQNTLDQIFAEERRMASDFAFDHKTAAVFDNMVDRSVPFYQEIQRMTGEIAADFAVPGTSLFDLGCSTGTTLHALNEVVHPAVHFVGVDNSQDMLDQAETKLIHSPIHRSYELINSDLHNGQIVKNASVVTMLLTLQFIRPLYRQQILENIYEGLNTTGCLILVEKITSSQSMLNRLFINYYYNFKKRNHYSDIEIAQKREALENVLIPYRLEENRELLYEAGFQHVEEFFHWYNFSALIAIK